MNAPRREKPLVLIADDDEDILELVRLRLTRCGYETVLARDGVAALAGIRSRRPDLVLLDVTMPGLDGYGVTAELRRDPETLALPVILLTALAQSTDVSRGFELGVDDYVTKPFSPQELEGCVAAALARVNGQSQSVALLRPASAGDLFA